MVNYDGLYNKEFFGDKLNENHFVNKALHFRIIENGIILPHREVKGVALTGFGGIVDSNGNFVKRSFVHVGIGGAYTPEEDIPYINAAVIYIGMLYHNWGHSLTDNLKRMWFLKSNIYKKNFRHLPIVYSQMGFGIIPNFAKILDILGIDPNNLNVISQPMKFRYIILPDESFYLDKSDVAFSKGKFFIEGTYDDFEGNDGSFYTKEYVETIDPIRDFALKNYSSISQKKYYFLHGFNQIGEENIAAYFQSKDYTIIKPEKLSLEEQFNIFANCESFASPLGSVSHNIIFLKDKSEVILIPRRSSYINIYQQALNQIHDLNIFYIDSALSIFSEIWSNSFCYIVSENLRKHFGDEIKEKYTDEDFRTFLAYLKYAKSNNLKENPNEMKYFQKLLPEFFDQLEKHQELIEKSNKTIR